jgi:hypothetical protein
MLIRFRVAGPLDFQNVQYLVVFNTSGNGVEPYPQGLQTGFKNYNFALVIGGNQYVSQPSLFQYYLAPGTASGVQTYRITIPPQLINFVPNSGGNPTGGGEFTIDFDRSLLNGVNLSGSPPPVATSPTETPTSAATFNPNVQPTTTAQHIWAINFITADPNSNPPNVPIDSMGIGGPTDATFSSGIVDTSTPFDKVFTKAVGTGTVSNSGAQLQGFEIINAP